MKTISNNRSEFIESLFSLGVLFVMFIFTFGILVVAPYSGFYFNPINGQIEVVFTDDESLLKMGDSIEQIGDISFTQFKSDRRLVLFQEAIKGEFIQIKVIREGEPITVSWVFPGFTLQEFSNRLFNTWILGYAFWLAGFTAQLSIRPRDVRRRLFIAANYLIAIFLVSGNLSSSHLWESSTFLHTSTWLMMPVFLQLHWEFPRPLGETSKLFWGALYTTASLLALGEIAHVVSRNLYAVGFLIAIVGSIVLLLTHLFIHKEKRQTVSLLLLSIFIAFSFSIATALAVAFGTVLYLGWFTIFSMPFMPLAYFYLINRRQLGDMETRVNRLLSTYAFLILLGVILFVIIISILQTQITREFWAFIAMGSAFLASLVTIAFLPRFQAFVDQRLFGIKLPYQGLPEIYSSRIATCENLPNLLALLENEVFPSLLVRQYAFVQSNDQHLKALLTKGIPSDLFDTQNAGRTLPSQPQEDWIRLTLPLKVGDTILGFWLLGKRDPDDLYPQVEIPILQSLANQTAIAFSNILQTDQILSIYQIDLEKIENERKRIARDLHDHVLNQIAAMRNSLDPKTLPPTFLETYEDIKLRVREIINDLRPTVLDHGLAFALTEYIEDLREMHPNINIIFNIQSGEERIPEKMEEHIYYIVREACENALRHANARTVELSGVIAPEQVNIAIQDDGDGFDSTGEINDLIANRHFGLATMKERAHLAGAEMSIQSQKNQGTTIHILWQPKL
jgi:signal transduction histidine kinase